MTERDALELLIQIRAEGSSQLQQLTKITQLLEAADKRATDASKEHEHQTKRTADSMQGAFVKAQLLTEGIMRLAGAVKTYTVESAQYAARTEQVAAVMDNLARVNGMSVQSVRQVADGIKELGISTQESRNVINMMIGSQLDLSKSLDLTRMAQNAAKVAGINSSDALQRLVYAVTSAQPEMLRTLGIAVNFEGAYARWAKASDRTVNSLTEQEKLNIRLDAVLARSPLIDGSYVMSLTTAAGQMQSLQRYTDDLKNALGQGLQPVLFDIVTGMERLTKYAQENIDNFQQMTAGVTALGVAGAVFAATPFLPPVARGAVAGAAGVGTYIAMDQDPVQANVDKYQAAMKKLEGQQQTMKHQLELELIDKAAFDKFVNQLPAFRQLLKARFIEENTEIYKQRRAAFQGMTPPGTGAQIAQVLLGDLGVGIGADYERAKRAANMPDAFDLGGGISVSRAEMESALLGNGVKFDKSGLVAKNPLMDQPKPTGESGVKLLARQQQFQHILDALAEQGLDPLARLLLDTKGKLRDFVAKYGALSGADDSIDADGYFVPGSGGAAAAGRALRANLGRAISKRNVPLVDIPGTNPAERGFLWAGMPTVTNTVEVDPAKTEAMIATARERAVRGIQRYVQYQEQMIRLMAGPGGEAAAINAIVQLRIQAAKDEFKVSKQTLEDRMRMEESIDAARKDRLLQIAQMQHAELERYRQAAGSIYDAMVAKGMTGIQDFLKGQLQVIGRTVFQNIAVEVFRTAKDSLKLGDLIGGQVDKNGKLTGLGRVLAGTPFGVDQSKLVLEQNTNETRLNTAAIKENTAAQRTGLPGSGGGKEAADAVGDLMDKGGTKLASKVQRMMGSIITIGAGAYGIAQGVQQGGVKGVMNTTAGIASMASGLIGSKLFGAAAAAGPWGGILAGAAAGIGLIASFFGQSKQNFDKEQTEALNRNKYEAPVATNRTTDIRGGDVDYDYMGRLRSNNDRTTVITLNVNAMDVKSFLDRSGDIAEALAKELRLGHRVSLDIVQSMLGA